MRPISGPPQFPAVDPAAKPQLKATLDALQQPNSVVPVIFESSVSHVTPNRIEKPAANVSATPNGEMSEQEKKVVEMPAPSKVVADLREGQGVNTTPKDVAKAPNVSNQGKPVHKVETVPAVKPLVEQGQQKPATRGSNPKAHGDRAIPSSGDRFTEFINRTKIIIRATSDVGKHSSGLDAAKIKIKASSKK